MKSKQSLGKTYSHSVSIIDTLAQSDLFTLRVLTIIIAIEAGNNTWFTVHVYRLVINLFLAEINSEPILPCWMIFFDRETHYGRFKKN
ncbi:hypothetical protein VB10N_39000 [Vibrio sp. 10N]|nr:hypothetical protein VB10N_39000 [Vibrio sp. 10N]